MIVAHRPETIASADRALIMEGGRIVAVRNPREYLRELRGSESNGHRPLRDTARVFPAVSS